MINRIALAFIIAMLYMVALELPYQIILTTPVSDYELRGLYELKVIGLFFGLWIVVGILIHADQIISHYYQRDKEFTA